jgi:hypothetical protein
MVASDDDWRFKGQGRFLTGIALHRAHYRASRPDWDHDHCEFCHAKFMDVDASDISREGFTTDDESRWICDDCFRDFRERFQWSVH